MVMAQADKQARRAKDEAEARVQLDELNAR